MEPANSEEETDLPREKLTELDSTSWVLSERDSVMFIETLLNPPEPSEGLRAAYRRYKERMGNCTE